MLIKILGVLDIITAIIFWIHETFNFDPLFKILLIVNIILLVKGLIFLITGDVISSLDIFCALVIFLSFILALPALVIFIISFYLLQKGIISLF